MLTRFICKLILLIAFQLSAEQLPLFEETVADSPSALAKEIRVPFWIDQLKIQLPENSLWKLNTTFPRNLSLLYHVANNWSAGIAGRIFDSRCHVQLRDGAPNGIAAYRASAAEFRLNYQCGDSIVANTHFGSTVGGKMKVENNKYRTRKEHKFKPAGYIGGEIEIGF